MQCIKETGHNFPRLFNKMQYDVDRYEEGASRKMKKELLTSSGEAWSPGQTLAGPLSSPGTVGMYLP